jgi:hypothetical protein
MLHWATPAGAAAFRWKDDAAAVVDFLLSEEAAMGSVTQRVIQHDFGFPRFVDPADAEVSALYSLCIVVSAAKRAALELMRDYPEHATMCQAIVDFATDGESDIRGTIVRLDEERPRPYRGGAT